ncbi:hypothetical protein [Cognatishimia sp. MH4019]|uniref:hypothetical protein n=1 Tax=Cognatishimia sp. MH4019 TaxID=2854030 RepID=UPI001CD237E4|nr:hypothetical protein [Cognatishimia sp. MH4019]
MSALRWLWALDWRPAEFLLGLEMMRRGFLWLTGWADMASPIYGSFTALADHHFWGLLFLVVGLGQIAGIVINGNWHHSPTLRKVCLLFSFAMFAILMVAFWSVTTTGAGVQAWTSEALNAVMAAVFILNIASKQQG